MAEPSPLVQRSFASDLATAALRDNPAWKHLLGLCPLLAVTTNVSNAAGLAAASSLVLIGAMVSVGLLRRFISAPVRLPAYVVVIATFTTVAMLLMQAFAFDVYERIALFVQIIVTNCLILARVEQVAARRPIIETLANAIGASIGFSIALLALAAARQGLAYVLPVAATPTGAFIIAGLLIALVRLVEQGETNGDLHAAPPGESQTDD